MISRTNIIFGLLILFTTTTFFMLFHHIHTSDVYTHQSMQSKTSSTEQKDPYTLVPTHADDPSKNDPSSQTSPVEQQQSNTATSPTESTIILPPKKDPKQGDIDIVSVGEGDLSCPGYPEAAKEVQYWRSLPSPFDKKWQTPFNTHHEKRYVTFESDHGGWNNIRMQMEMIVVFALITGLLRILLF